MRGLNLVLTPLPLFAFLTECKSAFYPRKRIYIFKNIVTIGRFYVIIRFVPMWLSW